MTENAEELDRRKCDGGCRKKVSTYSKGRIVIEYLVRLPNYFLWLPSNA